MKPFSIGLVSLELISFIDAKDRGFSDSKIPHKSPFEAFTNLDFLLKSSKALSCLWWTTPDENRVGMEH